MNVKKYFIVMISMFITYMAGMSFHFLPNWFWLGVLIGALIGALIIVVANYCAYDWEDYI